MSRPTVQETEREKQNISRNLAGAGNLIEAITSASLSVDAMRATLLAVCSLANVHQASVELSAGSSTGSIVIARYPSRFEPDAGHDYASVVYPLAVQSDHWQSAFVTALLPAVHDADLGQILASLLSILGSTLDRLSSMPSTDSLLQAETSDNMRNTLATSESVDELRARCCHWLAGEIECDFAVVRTTVAVTGNSPETRSAMSCWPDAGCQDTCTYSSKDGQLVQPAGAGLILAADISLENDVIVQIVVGRNDHTKAWSEHDIQIFDMTRDIAIEQLKRLTNPDRDAIWTNYIRNMQELTAITSAASDLDELSALLHEAVVRLIPVDRFEVLLNLSGNGFERIYIKGADSLDPCDQLEYPLLANGIAIGLLRVASQIESGYSNTHQGTLRAVCNSVAGAFERQLLLQQIASQSRHETGLRLIAERINATLDMADLMQIASDVIFNTVPSTLVTVSVIDRSTRRVQYRSVRSDDTTLAALPLGLPIGDDSLSYEAIVTREQRQVVGQQYMANPSFASPPWNRFGSAVATPIQIDAEYAGVIVLASDDESEFSENELTLQRQIAAMLSTALLNAIAYSAQIRHTRDLSQLQRLASGIASRLDLQQSLDEIVLSASTLVNADGSAVAVLDNDEMVIVGEAGSVAGKLPNRVPVDREYVVELLERSSHLAVNDLQDASQNHLFGPGDIDFARAFLAVRLSDGEGNPAGILCVFSTEPRTWTGRDISLLTTLGSASAVALNNARHFESTRDLLRASVESLATAVEAKDPGAQNHSRQVAHYARMIADELDVSADVAGEIELAGLLHDVGKIGIPDSVLEKSGPLDSAEWAAMQLHPAIGEQILSGNPTLESLLPMVRHHHERWDGNGYPDRLRRDQIPFGAAVIAVAEALDTMTAHRPYQAGRAWQDAIAEIKQGRGSQFAPYAVDAVLRLDDRDAFVEDEARVARRDRGNTGWSRRHSPALDVRALRIMEAVASEIREGADLNTFLTNIMSFLRDILDVPFVAVFTRSEDGKRLELVASDPITDLVDQLQERIDSGEGVVSWVARHGVIQNIPDVAEDSRYVPGVLGIDIRSELSVPLIAEGETVGVLNFESDQPDDFSEADVTLLSSTADHIANAIHVVQLHQRLKILSTTDALTGLDNHRVFFDRLVEQAGDALDSGAELSVVIMDVNNLKDINDSYGHLVGDAALKAVAEVIVSARRPGDSVCRYGGDEFALILPGTSMAQAWSIMEGLTLELMDGEFEAEGVTMPLPTSSWGIATAPEDGHRPIELMATADERMYVQKNGGRD